MRDFFLERPGLMIGIFFAFLVLLYIEPWNRAKKIEQIARETEGRPGEARPAGKESSRMQEANKARYKEPLKALALVEEVLAKPADAREREAAQALLPELLELAYHQHARDQQLDEARKVMGRLVAEFPDHRATLSVRLGWGRTLGEQLRAAAKANDAARVETVFKEYAGGGYHQPRRDPKGQPFSGDSQVLQEYARFQVARWKALPADSRTQGEGLALATEAFGVILEHNEAWQLFNLVQEKPPVYGRELLELAQSFDQRGLVPQAFVAHIMANGSLQSGRNWEAGERRNQDYKAREELHRKIDARIAELAVALAAKLAADPRNALTSMTPDLFLGMAVNQIHFAEHRTGVLEQRLALATQEYLADTLPLARYDLLKVVDDTMVYEAKVKLSEFLHQARNQGNRIDKELRRALFDNLTRDTNAVLWPKVPPQVMAQIERAVPANTRLERLEETKRETLHRLVIEGKAPNPVETAPAFQERRLQVAALNGVYLLGSNREEGFRDLRTVIHEGGDAALKGRVQQAVQTAFRLSRKQEKFDALIELAGFYAAEYGDTLAGDPFRDEFRKALEATAGKFKAGEKMKYVFVQALLASAFANEELGRKAQQETVARAFELVQGVTAEKSFGALKLPSGLTGWSTVAVDNSTEHHILLVYDGPESFSVLCNPRRKGSFALKNGTYRIAVMTPLGNIRPYRSERTLTDEHAPADYHIQRSGGGSRSDSVQGSGSDAYGDYTLLRPSEGLSNTQVDARTGLIKRPL